MVFHIRRCHVCGETNQEENSAIRRCSHCGKHLAPFYYFDESRMEGLSTEGVHWSQWKEVAQYNPLWGLSTYWETNPQES
ncbi:MAG: hypothetical protein ACK5RO_02995 [Pseudobdellovibrionaceae bacterium]